MRSFMNSLKMFCLGVGMSIRAMRFKRSPLGLSSDWHWDHRMQTLKAFPMIPMLVLGTVLIGLGMWIGWGNWPSNAGGSVVPELAVLGSLVVGIGIGVILFGLKHAHPNNRNDTAAAVVYSMWRSHKKREIMVTDIRTAKVKVNNETRTIISRVNLDDGIRIVSFLLEVDKIITDQIDGHHPVSGPIDFRLYSKHLPKSIGGDIVYKGQSYDGVIRNDSLSVRTNASLYGEAFPMGNQIEPWFKHTSTSRCIAIHSMISDMVSEEHIALSRL